MGKQSRLKLERREQRLRNQEPENRRMGVTPFRVLRDLHRTIQDHCHESGRRCWEYLLEMIAHSSGWQTDTADSKHLWDKMADESRWLEFAQSWMAEVEWAKNNGAAFSEPIGQLLEEIGGGSDRLGQFLTPMSVVRMMNMITTQDSGEPMRADGMPTHRGLDPACGTGRFMIDALVHNDNLVMHGVDLDLWMVRAAMLNVRLLARWTTLRLKDPDDRMKPLRKTMGLINSLRTAVAGLEGRSAGALNPWREDRAAPPDGMDSAGDPGGGDLLIIGGRSIFINADALIVDLNYGPNWTCAGWHWLPKPWRSNLKIDGYYGSYDEWEAAGKPRLGAPAPDEPVQFDYQMAEKHPRPMRS